MKRKSASRHVLDLSMLAALLGILLHPGTARAAVSDGFGDGDRNNDGVLDDPDGSGSGVVDDAGDVGLTWYTVAYGAGPNQNLRVTHEAGFPGGLGDDNALHVEQIKNRATQVAGFDAITLTNPGDSVRLSLQFRLLNLPVQRDTFRFGLFNSGATPIAADQPDTSLIQNHVGYWASFPTGARLGDVGRINRSVTGTTGPFTIGENLGNASADTHSVRVGDTGPHSAGLTLTRTAAGTIVAVLELDEQIIMVGEDTLAGGAPYFTFNEIAIGDPWDPPDMLSYYIDDVVVDTGAAVACAAAPLAGVGFPLPAGAGAVTVNRIDPAASSVQVYADGVLVGSGIPGGAATADISVNPPLALNANITATQTVSGVESCQPVPGERVGDCRRVPAVSVSYPYQPGETSVQVTGVNAAATEVRVYRYGGELLGSAAAGGAATVDVGVPPLVPKQIIVATQIVNGVESCIPTTGLPVPKGQLSVALFDSFGDADRNNDGLLDHPDGSGTGLPDSPPDAGTAWYKLDYRGTQALKVAPDADPPAGLGADNAFWTDVTPVGGQPYSFLVANLPSTLTLAAEGDFIRLSYRLRFQSYPNSRDVLRFGLFDSFTDQDYRVSADGGEDVSNGAHVNQTRNHSGYFATLATGATNAAQRLVVSVPFVWDGTAAGAAVGLDEVLVQNNGRINDTLPHTMALTLARVGTPDDPRIRVIWEADGVPVLTAEDTRADGNPNHGPYFDFNEVIITSLPVSGTQPPDYLIDDVEVKYYVDVCGAHNPVFDIDGNGSVDSADLGVFLGCATGPAAPAGVFDALDLSCRCLDADGNRSIDQADFGAFQRCFTGEFGTTDPTCDD